MIYGQNTVTAIALIRFIFSCKMTLLSVQRAFVECNIERRRNIWNRRTRESSKSILAKRQFDRILFANGISKDCDFLFVVHKAPFEEHVGEKRGMISRIPWDVSLLRCLISNWGRIGRSFYRLECCKSPKIIRKCFSSLLRGCLFNVLSQKTQSAQSGISRTGWNNEPWNAAGSE